MTEPLRFSKDEPVIVRQGNFFKNVFVKAKVQGVSAASGTIVAVTDDGTMIRADIEDVYKTMPNESQHGK